MVYLGYAVTTNGLWFNVAVPDGKGVLKMLRFSGNTTREVLRLDRPPPTTQPSPSPDERYVLMSRPDERGTNLMMIDNFR